MATFAAVAGGGVFGDHCSPLSDTTVLSSLGSACDHIDHTRTQLPYAVVVALFVAAAYLLVGSLAT
jgi:Na+/H+ antiporter NhaC